MLTVKATMKSEALYSDDKEHRFLIKRTWNATQPSAAILMLAPSDTANEIAMDMTGMYVLNNCQKQGFGSVAILNLYSGLQRDSYLNSNDNDSTILKTCKEAHTVILAYGTGCQTKQVQGRIRQVLQLLEPLADKLCQIADGHGAGYHPLGRTVRHQWELVPFSLPKLD